MSTHRFGIVVPWMNRAVESELPRHLGDLDVSLHWSRACPRVLPSDRFDESYLSSLLEDIPNAYARLAPTDLSYVIVACTSVAFDKEQLTVAGASTRIITTQQCIEEELSVAVDAQTLLCTPYSADLTNGAVASLEGSGYRITTVARILSSLEYREIPATEIARTIASAYTTEIERVVVSCTALYTTEVPSILAKEYCIDIPFISSNSAIASFIRRTVAGQSYAIQ